GHSRKGFIGKVIGDKMADLAAGGIGVSLSLANQGVQVLRVHDVAPTLHALKLYVATCGL
ncbi:MAG: dihydropteroate synthase, partial [Pirellulales bacterium]